MIEVATANLNTLPYKAVSPAESTILEEIQLLREEVRQLREENEALQERISELEEHTAKERALDRQRITKLEASPEEEPKVYSPKVAGHLNAIHVAIQERERSTKGSARKWDYMSYWEAAELLGLSHRRISQLADIARNDPRFIIGWHPKKKNTKVFRINPINLGNLASMAYDAFRATS